MKQIVKTIIALAIAAALLLVVRSYLFTVYTVTTGLDSQLRQGDRVLVNKWSQDSVRRGDLLVFSTHATLIGRVVSVPGDTIRFNHSRYLIPQVCCHRCLCPDCKLYLVNTGSTRMLVHKHQVVGHATRLFHLPW